MSLMPASNAATAPANCFEGTRTLVDLAPTFAAALEAVGFFPFTAGFALADAGREVFNEAFAFGFEDFGLGFAAFFTGLALAGFDVFALEDLCLVAIVGSATYNVYPAQSQAGSRFWTIDVAEMQSLRRLLPLYPGGSP